jgi:hypothetical protein
MKNGLIVTDVLTLPKIKKYKLQSEDPNETAKKINYLEIV